MRSIARNVALSSIAFAALASVTLVTNACTVESVTDDAGSPSPDGGGGGGEAGAQPTLPFQPSNVTLTGHDLSALPDVDVSADCAIDSGQTMGQGLCDSPAVDWIETLSDNVTKVHVFAVKSLRLEQNAKLTIRGGFAAVIVAFGDVTLLGQVNAAAAYDRAGPGGYSQTTGFTAGGGPGGGPAGVFDGKGPAPGTGATAGISGGGGTFCGVGAQGTQEGDTAGPLTVSPGPSKPAYGTADLRPLLAGSSGGTGGLSSAGSGGGAVQFVAGGAFTLGSLGYINVGGGGGSDSGETNAGQEASGGGSGGAILIEATSATITGVLAANGGGGGGRDTQGQDATPDGNAASGGTNGGAAQGGKGGAAAVTSGSVGTVTAASAAGAGGGGVGWIRINTQSGAATISGTVSPATTTSCASQGKVRAPGSGA